MAMSAPDEARDYVVSIKRGQSGTPQEFRLKGAAGMTVLEALLLVYRNEEDSLGFRYSCTVGRCLSCLMRMNGRNIVSCREPLVDHALLEPLPNRGVIRDLATPDSFAQRATGRHSKITRGGPE